jgi:hypothetical protein
MNGASINGSTISVTTQTPTPESGEADQRPVSLPPRKPTGFTQEELQLLRSWTTNTITRLLTLNALGRQDASERLQAWIDKKGWDTDVRDPLLDYVDKRSSRFVEELEQLASKVQPRNAEIHVCDFAELMSVDWGKIPKEIQRLLELSACVPICMAGDCASLVIGSINPMMADAVAQEIQKRPLADRPVPFVTPMRLLWSPWVTLLARYGI